MSIFSPNTIKSGSECASQWVCNAIVVGNGDSVLVGKCGLMRFSDFLLLCQEYMILCPVWRPWCWTQSVTHSAFLVFFPLQDQRDSLFFHPCIYSGRNHSPLPLILLPLKTLCKISIRLGFYERLEELLSWSSSCFPLLSLQVSFVSYGFLFQKSLENSHWWATFPSHSLCFFAFLFLNSIFDFKGVSGWTRSKLCSYSTTKNFHC